MWSLILLLSLCQSLELYIVPHSHCDPGWLDTVDWYYQNQVKGIFSNILSLLEEDSKRKIVWSETSFLKMWMDDQTEERKNQFKKFLKSGQIEIVGGGFVQSDEANPDFEMLVRQIENGHQYLFEEFGIEKVKVGWQIDPFGHSAITPSILARFGYEYLVINRISEAFRDQLRIEGNMEFIWKGADLGSEDFIFAHVLRDFYYPPAFLQPDHSENCFYQRDVTTDSIAECAEKVYNLTKEWAGSYQSDKIMMIFGGDFYFMKKDEAYENFRIMELVRDYVEDNYLDFEVKISTASEYFEAVRASKAKFSVYQSDFLPYQNFRSPTDHAYWTGFYSTRPALKKMIYETHRLVRAAEIAKAIVHSESFTAHNASLALHHDAITGTCRTKVAEDYNLRLKKEKNRAYIAINEVMRTAFTKQPASFELALPYKVVIIYNSLNWQRTNLLSIKSDNPNLEIKNWNGKHILSQCVENDFDKKYIIYFKISLPPLSFVTLFVTEHPKNCEFCSVRSSVSEDKVLEDKNFKIDFNSAGFVTNLMIPRTNITHKIDQNFWTYVTWQAGAYSFQPLNPGWQPGDLYLESFKISNGPVVQVAEIIWKRLKNQGDFSNYYQKIILYGESKFIWNFGLYAVTDEEIMLRFDSPSIAGDSWLFTSNSVDLRERKYFSNTNPTRQGQNMYPVPGGFAVKMGNEYLKIFPKFSLGVVMAGSNTFEILMHRNLISDDGFGLDQVIDDRTFVDYHFEVELGDLEFNLFKKSNIEAKSDIYYSWVKDPAAFKTTNYMSSAHVFNDNWEYNTKYLLGFNNSDIYLSSAVIKDKKLIFRLWNFNDAHSGSGLQDYKIGKRKLLGGYLKAFLPSPWKLNRAAIDFKLKANTGMALKFDQKNKNTWEGDTVLKPLEFSAFQVKNERIIIRKKEESLLLSQYGQWYEESDNEWELIEENEAEEKIKKAKKKRKSIQATNERSTETKVEENSEEIEMKRKPIEAIVERYTPEAEQTIEEMLEEYLLWKEKFIEAIEAENSANEEKAYLEGMNTTEDSLNGINEENSTESMVSDYPVYKEADIINAKSTDEIFSDEKNINQIIEDEIIEDNLKKEEKNSDVVNVIKYRGTGKSGLNIASEEFLGIKLREYNDREKVKKYNNFEKSNINKESENLLEKIEEANKIESANIVGEISNRISIERPVINLITFDNNAGEASLIQKFEYTVIFCISCFSIISIVLYFRYRRRKSS